jgi:hypothetical protein
VLAAFMMVYSHRMLSSDCTPELPSLRSLACGAHTHTHTHTHAPTVVATHPLEAHPNTLNFGHIIVICVLHFQAPRLKALCTSSRDLKRKRCT